MKKLHPLKVAAIIVSIVAVISMFFYGRMITQPISYGLSYYHASAYEGDDFNGAMVFYPDNTVRNRNTNFDEDIVLRYYYKDGYVFFTLATTDEEYAEEVTLINANFEEAVNTPFYADKIDAFKMIAEGLDDYTSRYFCRQAIFLAIAWGAVELAMVGFVCIAFIRCKKVKNYEN